MVVRALVKGFTINSGRDVAAARERGELVVLVEKRVENPFENNGSLTRLLLNGDEVTQGKMFCL